MRDRAVRTYAAGLDQTLHRREGAAPTDFDQALALSLRKRRPRRDAAWRDEPGCPMKRRSHHATR
jgi:hypothetical protein